MRCAYPTGNQPECQRLIVHERFGWRSGIPDALCSEDPLPVQRPQHRSHHDLHADRHAVFIDIELRVVVAPDQAL
jgi:hypothetical protein